jgi:hypothetical protein
MFMQIAIGAIGIGIVLMVGYLIIAQVKAALTSSTSGLGTEELANITKAMTNTQNTVFAGFAFIAVGIIVLAAFGLINIFQ